MSLFTESLYQTLEDFSEYIHHGDYSAMGYPASLLFGLSLNEENECAVLSALGFAKADDFWVRDKERYEAIWEESSQGFFTIGDWETWRQYLLSLAQDKQIYLRLPAGMDLLSLATNPDCAALVHNALRNLCSVPGVRILFAAGYDAGEQAALYVSLNLFSWPYAWRIIIEDLHCQHMLTPEKIEALCIELTKTNSAEEIGGLLSQIQSRLNLEQPIHTESIPVDGGIEHGLQELKKALQNFS